MESKLKFKFKLPVVAPTALLRSTTERAESNCVLVRVKPEVTPETATPITFAIAGLD